VQRFILEHVDSDTYSHWTVAELARARFLLGEPSPADYESTRRAAERLAQAGLVLRRDVAGEHPRYLSVGKPKRRRP
jgi:hypothetical protein